jgi:hypothetical protein
MQQGVVVEAALPQVKALQACPAMVVKLLRQVVLVLLIEAVEAVGQQSKQAQLKQAVLGVVAWSLFLYQQQLIAALLLDHQLLRLAD